MRTVNRPMTMTLVLLLLAMPSARAGQHFSDPRGSMQTFYGELRAIEAGESRGPVRVLYFGTSEIGYDRVTSQIRRIFQKRFGDGGKGYMIIFPPWSILRHQDIVWKYSKRWFGYSMRMGTRRDGIYGLGGVLASNNGKAWAEFSTVPAQAALRKGYFAYPAGTRMSHFELHYQSFPDGGSIDVEVDGGQAKQTIETSSEDTGDRVFALDLVDGAHTIKISASDKPVRLYGVVFERAEGFVIDALMIIGGWAHSFLNYEHNHLRTQVKQRDPDLLIFQLGAKEAYIYPEYSNAEVRTFVRDFAEGVNRVMSGHPNASCLIISPKDMGIEVKKRRRQTMVKTRTAIPRLVKGCERVARLTGCAFYNIYEALGGAGTMVKWRRHKPPLVSSDYGHLMDGGALKTGDTIASELLDGYEQFVAAQKP